ncbi:hypothetical protein CANARDRAFT_27657 [[Candida] arabinofermentans NRRL YB-2248]|uniref:Uncharacterized protein n=1 Tax=[Candida] arabinofermentans NRRL YB-2248 TaxID=983967 RepID=A0A1E4T3V6_9ASCO|nr:hypothetical protein CANARDRAFT_27657 [[Candida] arabinofermentans NRRL YB-2248]
MDSSDYENITSSLYDHYSQGATIPLMENSQTINTSSPLKDKKNLLVSLSLSSPSSPSTTHGMQTNSTIPSSPSDYKRLERQYADLILKDKHLNKEFQIATHELMSKTQQVISLTSQLNGLIQQNKNLKNDLADEKESIQSQREAWAVEKATLKVKISSLTRSLREEKERAEYDSDILENDYSTEEDSIPISHYKSEIETLKRRCKILERENEFEVQSKMLIIDELEAVRGKYTELEEKYEQLHADNFNDISSRYDDEEEEEDVDYEEDTESSDIKGNSLAHELKLLNGGSRVSSTGTNKSGDTGKRHSSLNRYINKNELSYEKQHKAQELIKLDFQMKSLQLQNEKLQSYIGFLLQHHGSDDNEFEIYKDDLSYEYSDEINIQNARKTLKTVIRSASAMPIQPESTSGQIDEKLQIQQQNETPYNERSNPFLEDHTISARRSSVADFNIKRKNNRHINNTSISSQGNSIFDKSEPLLKLDSAMTRHPDQYEEDVEYVELGDSDFTISSEEEEEYQSEELSNVPYNDSLNVSFTMDLTPSLNIKKRKKSKVIDRTPRQRLQKLTVFNSPSSVGSNGSSRNANSVNYTLSNKSSMKNVRKYASNLELIGELASETIGQDFTEENYEPQLGYHALKTSSSIIFKKKLLEQKEKLGLNAFDVIGGKQKPSALRFDENKGTYHDDDTHSYAFSNLGIDQTETRMDLPAYNYLEFDPDSMYPLDITMDEINMFKMVPVSRLFCSRHFFFLGSCRNIENGICDCNWLNAARRNDTIRLTVANYCLADKIASSKDSFEDVD